MPIDRARVEEIFGEAVEIADAAARASFLDQACGGDGLLRERLDALLAAHDSALSFMSIPAQPEEATVAFMRVTEGPGSRIGRYKLLEEIGEGGFGVVFMADQEEPVRRRVALKIIKAGMDTRQVVARFEAERQALAMMDHPNIARVFDAGATDAGRPYFVMELVKGIPITAYCDQQKLSTDQRLNLFITVCSAVQHAHQKGIIHRDLKPSNVMVTLHDDKPVPKIIDFGIAKATQARLTEKTLFTEFRQLVGTPAYMSPEQAQVIGLDVDTRSDIYSLGVLLYELLTGTTPFDSKQLLQAGYDEMRRIIRDVEPQKPSTRLSTLADGDQVTRASDRGTDLKHLSQQLRGDLDWIVMKCLEKDRTRRYETAGSLAADIERHLHDEPVKAFPPSTVYRFRKFARRNKVALAFAALFMAGFVFLAFSNVALKRERDAKTTALARAQAVSDFLQEMLASSNPEEVKGSEYTVRALLDDFSAGLGNQLAGEPEVEADIQSVIGKSYWRLGESDRAESHLKQALDLRRQVYGADDERVAETLVDYAWSLTEQRRYAEAETRLREALVIYRMHDSNPRATMRALWCLQECLFRQSRLAEAEQAANDALALAGAGRDSDYAELPLILHTLADAKSTEGKHEEAEPWARRALDMHRRLHGNHHPETAWGLWILGRALIGQQKLVEAETALRESLAIFHEYYTSEHRSILGVSQELESVLRAKGDRAGIEALTREEREQSSRSDAPDYQVRLAELLLSNNPPNDAQKEEAHRLIRRAMEGYGQVAVDSPRGLNRRLKAAEGYIEVARICAAVPGFTSEVDEVNRILKAEFSELIAVFPEPAVSVDAHYFIAIAQLRLGDEAGYRATCQALVDLSVRNLDVTTKSRPIWTACLGPDAVDDMNPLVKRAEEFVANISPNYRHFGLCVLGAALYRAGQYERAAERLKESIAVYPSVPKPGHNVINCQRLFLAMSQWQLGQWDDARRLLAETQPAVDKELQPPFTLWDRRATLELLRREAEALIELDQSDQAVETDDPPPIAPRNAGP